MKARFLLCGILALTVGVIDVAGCGLINDPKTPTKIVKTVNALEDIWLTMPDGSKVLVPARDLQAMGEARLASARHPDGGPP